MLNDQYNICNDQKLQLFYSKLALLELCGWIEEAMDAVAMGVVRRKVRDQVTRERVEKEVVRRISGFVYNDHFRVMLSRVIGEVGVYKLEKILNIRKFTVFCATLSSLKDPRNSQAHTHVKGTQQIIDAPSVTMSKFDSVLQGLADIEGKLQRIGY